MIFFLNEEFVFYWRVIVDIFFFFVLIEDMECDVVVIGGGIMGLIMVYELMKRGFCVVVIEVDWILNGMIVGMIVKIIV